MKRIYNLNASDSFIFYRSYAFDGSIEETLLPLITGGKVNICETGFTDIEKFRKVFTDGRISIANFNSEIIEVVDEYLDLKNLKKVIAGGTRLRLENFKNIIENGIDLYNTYGPTECTVNTTFVKFENLTDRNTIGKSIPNMYCYVADNDLNLMPTGAIGELYISGIGVGEGYLNNETLTREKFMKNPFQSKECKSRKEYGPDGANSILYKTGDLVRRMPCGDLEYIGRTDSQVKIRGFRVELEEIEKVLSRYDGIKQCVILHMDSNSISSDNNKKHLVGYYVSRRKLIEEDIICYLSKQLPSYMIPSTIIPVDKFPLTTNGKLNISALPEPLAHNKTRKIIAPRNRTEITLCKIWSEILEIPREKISIEDSFFRLGGNSISLIKLSNKVEKKISASNINRQTLEK